MRQIVLDTETTGLDPNLGHRVIEIGCIELVNRKFTGNNLHIYLNPERSIDEGALKVHGISNDFLKDKPFFRDIAKQFVDFIKDAQLIIHNAPFDVGFLNAELAGVKHNKNLHQLCDILDTLVLAREKHPGQRNNLDALCKRYNVNNSNRKLHGALLDAEILAFVYLAMTGGQSELFVDFGSESQKINKKVQQNFKKLQSSSPVITPNQIEIDRHNDFMSFMEKNKT